MKHSEAFSEPLAQELPEWMKPKPYKTTVCNLYLRRSYPRPLGMLRTLFVWVSHSLFYNQLVSYSQLRKQISRE